MVQLQRLWKLDDSRTSVLTALRMNLSTSTCVAWGESVRAGGAPELEEWRASVAKEYEETQDTLLRIASAEIALESLVFQLRLEVEFGAAFRDLAPHALPLVLPLLESDSANLREKAVDALATMKQATAIDKLIRVLETDPSPRVPPRAAIELGRIGGERVVQPLLKATRSANRELQAKAAMGLGYCNQRTASVVARLMEMFDDPKLKEFANARCPTWAIP